MKIALRLCVAYLGAEIVLQPAIWLMDGDKIDYLSHAAAYAAVAPLVLGAGVGMAVWALAGLAP